MRSELVNLYRLKKSATFQLHILVLLTEVKHFQESKFFKVGHFPESKFHIFRGRTFSIFKGSNIFKSRSKDASPSSSSSIFLLCRHRPGHSLGEKWMMSWNTLLGVGWTILHNGFHGAVHLREHRRF